MSTKVEESARRNQGSRSSALRIGVVGYGYWGPNIVRNFHAAEGAEVTAICDQDRERLRKAAKLYPGVSLTDRPEEVIASPEVDAVAVITPVSTHFPLAKWALEEGKHVFVEKPFTVNAAEAEELISLAEKKNLTIMVDHTFIFTGAVRKIKQLVDEGVLGDLYYYDSVRVNLGLFQTDVNVIWDLAPHDFAIMDYLVAERPLSVSACGKAHVNSHADTAYVTLHFANKMIAHFNVNWLSPVKVRTTLIGGEKKMLVWNDLEADEKLKIYDKGVEVNSREGVYDLLVSYRSGDMHAPKVEQVEALRLETEYFVRCVTGGERPVNDGRAGLRVVRMLEACNRSMGQNGAEVLL